MGKQGQLCCELQKHTPHGSSFQKKIPHAGKSHVQSLLARVCKS
jgi:hypothetical protein